MQSTGSDGHERYFRKPWFMTTIMFVGMSFCLPLAYLEERSKKSQPAEPASDGSEPLLPGGQRHNGEVHAPTCLHRLDPGLYLCA